MQAALSGSDHNHTNLYRCNGLSSVILKVASRNFHMKMICLIQYRSIQYAIITTIRNLKRLQNYPLNKERQFTIHLFISLIHTMFKQEHVHVSIFEIRGL